LSYIWLLISNLIYIDTQSRTVVGRPVAATTSNTINPQKYVLMSQRPAVAQVNYLNALLNDRIFIFFKLFLFSDSTK